MTQLHTFPYAYVLQLSSPMFKQSACERNSVKPDVASMLWGKSHESGSGVQPGSGCRVELECHPHMSLGLGAWRCEEAKRGYYE